jgi:uncharacterized protein YndB with AHSA1/START domain
MKKKFLIIIIGLALSSCKQDNNTMTMTDIQDKIITVTTVINCSADSAFDYFTDNSLLTKWLTEKADVELKEGGKYELFWTPQDPDKTNNSTYGCKILSFERPYYLNFEWRGNAEQKNFMNIVRPLTNVTVIFSNFDDRKTKITLIHSGWRQGENWELARQYFIKAWTGAFKQLERLINR